MIVPQGKIRDFFIAVRGTFNQGLRLGDLWYDKVAQPEVAPSETNRYWWTEDMGEMEKWVGAAAVSSLAARTFDVKNEKFRKVTAVDIFHIHNDQIGLYSSGARKLGMTGARWPQTMLKEVILKGDTWVCYDGQPFFDDAHPINIEKPSMGTQKNLFEGKPFSPNNWNEVSTTMKRFKSAAGNYLGVRPTHVACASNIATSVRQFFSSTIIAAADGINPAGATAENIHKGECQVIEIVDFPDGWWMPLDLSQFIRPFAWQVGIPVTFISQENPSLDRFFADHQHAYGIFSYGQAFATLPTLACLARP